MIANRMTAIAIEGGKGPAEALKPVQIETPSPTTGQILIEVRAAGVNRPDLLQRRGEYPPPAGAPSMLGLEVSGVVAVVGPGPSRWRPGDQVVALLGGGGYAQYAVVDGRHALPLPPGLNDIQGAALPETVFTVFANLFEHGALKAGETLMVHGATSGIGVAAIQMAKAAGARVIATSRGAAKAAAAARLGADLTIDTTTQDFVTAALAFGGVDVILDMVGGDFASRGLQALNPAGRMVMIAVQAGAKAEINLLTIMQRQLVLTGSTLRPRAADEKARLAVAVERTVWPWIAEGRLIPIIDRVFALQKAAEAHAWLERGDHVGKVVLSA
jgi:putative PIG3 family NAD(P)H quinone oxidoreductase